jgi:hypothetical protein
MSRQNTIANAFRPGREIDEPALFAGRGRQLEQLAQALHTEGACAVIYGDRGLGKSSLAVQAWRIALGEDTLLRQHGLEHWAIPADKTFLAFYISATDATPTTEALLRRISGALADVAAERKGEGEVLLDRTTRRRASLKVFEYETAKTFRTTATVVRRESASPEDEIFSLARALRSATDCPVLLIIDELDRVRDTAGLASFIKAFSGDTLRFMLVGIGQSVSELLADHQSIDRLADFIEVPRMNRRELMSIVDQAIAQLSREGVDVEFSQPANGELARVAGGFPWFVHVIGQAALLESERDGSHRIVSTSISKAVWSLTTNRFAQHFRDLYQMAVRDSLHREYVLRGFATWSDTDIPTNDVYRILKQELGVANPSIYKGHLTSEFYGRVLLAPPYQSRGLVRFANEMFKVYVRMRPSLFVGAADEVRRAFE